MFVSYYGGGFASTSKYAVYAQPRGSPPLVVRGRARLPDRGTALRLLRNDPRFQRLVGKIRASRPGP